MEQLMVSKSISSLIAKAAIREYTEDALLHRYCFLGAYATDVHLEITKGQLKNWGIAG
jgi:hypothetical protein